MDRGFIGEAAPTDVHLSEHDVVVPDLVVVLSERRHILTPHRIQGPPDLIIEILSESTAAADRGAKEALYARSGVPEYWIVDPDEHVTDLAAIG